MKDKDHESPRLSGVTLNTLSDAVAVPKDGLLLFLDETGGESLADDNHPVFGLGGCLVHAGSYSPSVARPWGAMRAHAFAQKKGPLHASKGRLSGRQKDALSQFFRTGQFGRLAAIMSQKTLVDVSQPNFQLIVAATMGSLDRLAPTFWPFSEVHVIAESSSRANPLLQRFLGDYDSMKVAVDGISVTIPLHKYFADKSASLAGLEVADFVMHAAGLCARANFATSGAGRDIPEVDAVFRAPGPHLASYLDISSARTPSGGQPAC